MEPALKRSQPTEETARRYAHLKRWLFLLDLALSLGFLLWVLASGWAFRLDRWVTQRISAWPIQAAVYVGVLAIGTEILRFPLELIRGFVVEHRFRLSTERLGQWLAEYAKQLGIGAVCGLLVVEGLVGLMRAFPLDWWKGATLLWMGWSLLLTWVAPTLLIPLFYRQTPLKNPLLKERLELLLKRCGAPVHGIFEVNLSRTTRKTNACLCGLGSTRRVLISDTLLSSHPAEEVEVVLAHEMGHHRLRHLGILLCMGTVAAGLSFAAAHCAVDWAVLRLGWEGGNLVGLPVVGLVFSMAGLALMPVTHGISRRLERQADQFALKVTKNPQAFVAALKRLARENLAELQPPAWVEFLLYDHPSIAKRIALAQQN